MSPDSNDRKNLLAVNLGLAVNALLAAAKTGVGILGGSPALLADGIHSASDVVYLAIVRAFMRLAGKPPDREHPFGHRQLEGIAAVVIGAFVMTTGLAVFWNAAHTVFEWLAEPDTARKASAFTLWVALLTVILKLALVVFTNRIARRTQSIAVAALARDHRNDVFSIATAAVGIALGQAGYLWVDPLAAAAVAVLIFYTGVTILMESSAELMDTRPAKHVDDRIHTLLAGVRGVETVEEVHVHRIGHYLLVDVTVGVDGTISVAEGDEIASRAERAVREQVEYLRRVSIHYHPRTASAVSDAPDVPPE